MNNELDLNIRHDLKRMVHPVGYLAPDGRWFLIESDENGLAHLYLSDLVYKEYEAYIKANRIYIFDVESDLEHAGFIKVHESDVRYYAQASYSGYYDQKGCKTPKVNDIQRKRLCEYARLFGYRGKIAINEAYNEFSAYELKQMDDLALQKVFEA